MEIKNSHIKSLQPEEYWKNHINSWKESGLSRKAYCEKETLSYHAFGYWQRKLAGRSSKKTSKSVIKFVKLPDMPQSQAVSPQFSLESGIQISVDNVHINLNNNFNAVTLTRLLNVLEKR